MPYANACKLKILSCEILWLHHCAYSVFWTCLMFRGVFTGMRFSLPLHVLDLDLGH